MKKTLIASAFSLATLSSTNANASLVITSMDWGSNYAATGTITDSGAWGEIQSIDDFFGVPWMTTQEADVITNSNGLNFSGSSVWGAYDFSADIALMTNEQVAVGMYMSWSTNNSVPLLAVFDCVTTPGQCIGQTTGQGGAQFGGMQHSPFPGQVPAFNGTGTLTAVPLPAAVWLFGSGLLGLIGVARRRSQS